MTRVFTMSDLHLNFIVDGTDFKHTVYDANLTCVTSLQRQKLFEELFFEHTTVMLPDGDTTQDILVLAGDTWEEHKWIMWNNLSWIEYVAKRFSHVVLVPGNHDVWHCNIHTWKNKADKLLFKLGISNVHILDNSTWLHGNTDTLFVGGILWTDFDNQSPLMMLRAEAVMRPDYRYIKHGSGYRRWTAEQCLLEHQKTKHYISRTCLNNLEKDIVVITHHLPSHLLCDAKYANSGNDAYYASSLNYFLGTYPNMRVWLAGHTHCAKDLTIYDTRCIVNPYGYVFSNGRTEDTGFDRNKHFMIGE